MSNLRSPKCPDSLKEKSLSNVLRQRLNFPEHVLISNFGDWSVETLIKDYFLFEQVPLSTGHTLYNDSIEFLKKLITSSDCLKGEKNFADKFLKYLDQTTIKRKFLQLYKDEERSFRTVRSTQERDEEVNIASNELVGENLRAQSEKRKLQDITNSRPLKITVKSKSYDIQSPSTSTVYNVPIIENDNVEQLSNRVDLCLSTSTSLASEELHNEYDHIKELHRQKHYINNIDGARDLFNRCITLSKADYVDQLALLDYQKSDFNRFIKFSMIDFGINTLRITEMPKNDERTMFVEVVVQLWKYFGNVTGLQSFKWCERKDKDAATAIFFANQEKSKTLLLDGMGSNAKEAVNIIIESSGLNISTDINHTLEDSVKNIKSATDALVRIMCRYPSASLTTLKKVHVYSLHTIQNNMTLIRYSWKDSTRWNAVECGSALLPVAFAERKEMLQVYELFAYVYSDLVEQDKIFDMLEDEHLGFVQVDVSDLISGSTSRNLSVSRDTL